MRTENKQWRTVFYVNRGALIIALILKIRFKNILKIYPLQVAIFNWIVPEYLWIKTIFDVEIKVDMECKKWYNWQQNEFLGRFYGEFEPPPFANGEAAWFSLLGCKKGSRWPGSLSSYCKSFLIRFLWHEFLTRD